MTTPRYPIEVKLIGEVNGNAFAIIGAVRAALRDSGVEASEVEAFYDEATSGDYDHLLRTCIRWVEIT